MREILWAPAGGAVLVAWGALFLKTSRWNVKMIFTVCPFNCFTITCGTSTTVNYCSMLVTHIFHFKFYEIEWKEAERRIRSFFKFNCTKKKQKTKRKSENWPPLGVFEVILHWLNGRMEWLTDWLIDGWFLDNCVSFLDQLFYCKTQKYNICKYIVKYIHLFFFFYPTARLHILIKHLQIQQNNWVLSFQNLVTPGHSQYTYISVPSESNGYRLQFRDVMIFNRWQFVGVRCILWANL